MSAKLKNNMSFRDGFEKLEEISLKLENSELDVEEASKIIKEAEDLHKILKAKLKGAKLKIRISNK